MGVRELTASRPSFYQTDSRFSLSNLTGPSFCMQTKLAAPGTGSPPLSVGEKSRPLRWISRVNGSRSTEWHIRSGCARSACQPDHSFQGFRLLFPKAGGLWRLRMSEYAIHSDLSGVLERYCERIRKPRWTVLFHRGEAAFVLFAVLTCIPLDGEQRDLVREISRVLRPGGLLYISDLLLNRDYGISKGTTVTPGNTGPTGSSSSQKVWLCVTTGKSGSKS